jgi:hypothetical protein
MPLSYSLELGLLVKSGKRVELHISGTRSVTTKGALNTFLAG